MDLQGVAPGVALRAGAMASVPAAVFGAWQVWWWKDELLRLRLRCLAGLRTFARCVESNELLVSEDTYQRLAEARRPRAR